MPTTHAMPPDTTEKIGPTSAATAPASRSPSRGPVATIIAWNALIRPRRLSGIESWSIVPRKMALTMSPAPATASNRSPSQRTFPASPKLAIASPQMAIATITAIPCRRTLRTQPDKRDPISAPAAGAAYRRPSPPAPILNTLRARAGKTAVGIPKIIAMRSAEKMPTSRRFRATYRIASAGARQPKTTP